VRKREASRDGCCCSRRWSPRRSCCFCAPSGSDKLCQTLRAEIPRHLGFDVKVAQCRIDPLTQTVHLSDVALSEPGVSLAAKEAEISLRNVFPGSITLDW